jgi:Cu(I)/Ag(I) efflux system membrane fusion protein
MTERTERLKRSLGWLWKHMAAGVAVALILAAFVIGYRIGRPSVERAAPSHDQSGVVDTVTRVYTCSMHPSVRLTDPDAKCPICFMDLIPVADDGGEENTLRITLSESAATLSRIETAPVGGFFPTAEVRLFGKVTYDETSVARLTAYFPGRIERLFVNYVGVRVNAGDHMAELYSPELLAAFEELRQSVIAARNAGGTSEIMRSTTRDTLDATREKLRLFGLTKGQIEAVESGSFDSDRLTIYAPIGGVVTDLAVREGDYVRTGAPIATLADLSRLWLDMEAYESQLPLLRWGQPVTFTVEAHPGETFTGQVSFIEPMVDERTRTASVRVAVDNTSGRLKPGMFASAVVRTRIDANGAVVNDELAGRWVSPMHPTIVKDGPGQCDICGMDLVRAEDLGIVGDPGDSTEPLVIPRSAVLYTGTRSVVYVEVPDVERPTYEGRTVVLGPRAGEFVIVREGLREGEAVVVNGAFRIDSAMQIAAKPSMMSPDYRQESAPARAPVSDGFVASLTPVYAAYLEAQEALAADDLDGFTKAATSLNDALGAVNRSGLVGEPLAGWRRVESQMRVEESLATIDAARARFERMSEGVLDLERRFGHRSGEVLHRAHCPMAFDFKGADWLQRGETINNPYFGDAMLRCGDIVESFDPVGDTANGERIHE